MIETAVLLAISLVAPAGPGPAVGQDTTPPQAAALERAARRAAWRYESALRTLIPSRFDAGYRGPCDERIGRYCMWFGRRDSRPLEPPPERPEVGEARTEAIIAHRRWFGAEPARGDAAGPLVRYLIDWGRPAEAVAAARAHAWAAGRDAPSLLVLGLALHYHGDFAAAEAVFDSARGGLDATERRRLDDVSMLLEPAERRRYDRLDDREREDYHARLWALSDPFHLQPGNERRSAHYARHAWAGIVAGAPRARGMISWGRDDEEILLRYGLPNSRERVRPGAGAPLASPDVIIERFDPAAVSFVPAALLTRGLPAAPEAGVRHEIERDSARSAYAPVRLVRTRGLPAQLSRFPEGVEAGSGAVVRVDAFLPGDTLEPALPAAPAGLLVVLDTLGAEVARAAARPRVVPDSGTALAAEVSVPPGAYLYRVELIDDSTGLAAVSQYRFDVHATAGLALSDLLVTRAFADSLPAGRTDPVLVPHGTLVLPLAGEVGLYAEARGLTARAGAARFAVEWWVEPAEPGSLVGRAARWLGRQLGLVQGDEPVRIRWEDASARAAAPIAVNLAVADLAPGLHRFGLTVTDRVTGESRSATRVVRFAAAPAGAPRPARR